MFFRTTLAFPSGFVSFYLLLFQPLVPSSVHTYDALIKTGRKITDITERKRREGRGGKS